jgi:hypothetical protein
MKAAIIRITDCSVNYDRTDILAQIQDIIDDLDVFSLQEFDNQEALNLLVMNTLMNSIPHEALERSVVDSDHNNEEQSERLKYNVGATVAGIYENHDYLYAAYFVTLEDVLGKESITKEEFNAANINHFGTQICSANVASDIVVVRQKLNYEVKDSNVATTMSLSNISEYDLVRDLVTIFQHRGLVVESNGDTTEYFYIQNPLENVIMTESDYESHYRYHEYEAFNHQVTIFIDLRYNEENADLNESASQIAGAKIYGRVLVSLAKRPDFSETPPYVDLTDDRFESIRFLRSRSTEIMQNIAKSEKTYVNFDKILNLSKSRYTNLPIKSTSSLIENLNRE